MGFGVKHTWVLVLGSSLLYLCNLVGAGDGGIRLVSVYSNGQNDGTCLARLLRKEWDDGCRC